MWINNAHDNPNPNPNPNQRSMQTIQLEIPVPFQIHSRKLAASPKTQLKCADHLEITTYNNTKYKDTLLKVSTLSSHKKLQKHTLHNVHIAKSTLDKMKSTHENLPLARTHS